LAQRIEYDQTVRMTCRCAVKNHSLARLVMRNSSTSIGLARPSVSGLHEVGRRDRLAGVQRVYNWAFYSRAP